MSELPDPTTFLAMHIMSGAAKNASATLDSLSGWMLAGFGAVIGLTLSQLQGLSAILDTGNVRWAGILFVTSVIPAFVAKLLAAMVAAASTGASDGMALGEKIGSWGPIDPKQLHAEIAEGTQWPLRWFNRKAMELAASNQVAAMGRLARDRVTMQMRLVLLQTVLTATAGLVLILGVKVV